MPGGHLALAALLLASLLLAGCELLDDGSNAPRTVAPIPTPAGAGTRPVVAPSAAAPRAQPPASATTAPATSSPPPGRGSPTPGSTPTTAAAATPVAPPPTLRGAASGYRRHTSTVYAYAIDYLETWRAVDGGATFDGGQADLFTADQRAALTSSVTVFSQPVAAGTTTSLFLESSLADLVEAGIKPSEEQERAIDGNDAYVFSYSLDRGGRAYAITQAIFLRQDRAWILTLTAIPDEAERLAPVFSHMLDSVQVWG